MALRLFFKVLFFASFLFNTSLQAQNAVLPPASKMLFERALKSKFASSISSIKYEVFATSDDKSFLLVWKPQGEFSTPKKWIVSLPGKEGFSTDDLAVWSKYIKNKDVGLISIQWWLGKNNAVTSYYSPEAIYNEVDRILQKYQVHPQHVMLHGFSRGSANSYALTAIDSGIGKKYFKLTVASSGGVGLDYPPNIKIDSSGYGKSPLRGTSWITVAGGKDPFPERDGYMGMRKAGEWLKSRQANIVMTIEDPNSGHGALMLNPNNIIRVLDFFLNEKF